MTREREALVTGGAQGLGLAAVLALLQSGFNVTVLDMQSESSFAENLKAYRPSKPVNLAYKCVDITDGGAVESALDDTFGAGRAPGVLVNNAGVADRPRVDILNLEATAIKSSLEVNLLGAVNVTNAVVNRLLTRGLTEGVIVVFVTSVLSEVSSPDRAPYCISKAGLAMLAKLYADRLAEYGVQVFDVAPGFIETPMTMSLAGTYRGIIEDGAVPMRRGGTVEEFGELIRGLSVGSLPYVTGQKIWLAGGQQLLRDALRGS